MSEPITADSESVAFDRKLGELTSSMGDPTRRAIYLAVRKIEAPVTTSEVAENFDLHPNVARHHLDRLADDGYLSVTFQRPPGRSGPGAGRPAKCYTATDKRIDVRLPEARTQLLLEMLVTVLDRVSDDDISPAAEAVGREFGLEMASSTTGDVRDPTQEEAVLTVARTLEDLGFEVTASESADRIITSYCPFGQMGTSHPEVVCSLDRGFVTGLMAGLHHEVQPTVTPHLRLQDQCVTEIPVTLGEKP